MNPLRFTAGAFAAVALASMGIALIPESWLLPSLESFALSRSIDGVVEQEGLALMLLAIRVAVGAGLGVGTLGIVLSLFFLKDHRYENVSAGSQVRRSLSPTGPAPEGIEKKALYWTLALTVGALTVRAISLGDGLLYDEAFTALHFVDPHQPWIAFTTFTTLNNHPIFSFLAALSSLFLGESEIGLRLPALLAGVATIPLAYLLGTRLAGRPAGYGAAGLCTLSPVLIFYSAQARGYAILILLTLGCSYALLRALEATDRRWWTFYAILAVMGVGTHLFMALVVLGQLGPVLVWSFKGDPRGRDTGRTAFLCATTVLAGMTILYLPVLHRVFFAIVGFTLVPEQGTIGGVMGRHPETLLLLSFGEWGPGWIRGLGAGAVVTLAGIGAWSLRERMDLAPWMTVIGPLAVAAVLSLGVGGLPRFFLFCTPLLLLLAAVGGVHSGAGAAGRASLLVGVGILFIVSGASRVALASVTIRDVADMLSTEVRPGDCLVTEWAIGDVVGFYYEGSTTADWASVSGCWADAERVGGRTLYSCRNCAGTREIPAAQLQDPLAFVGPGPVGDYRLYEVEPLN